jgi:hypothetical protein
MEKIASKSRSSQYLEAIICEFGGCGDISKSFTNAVTAPADWCTQHPTVCLLGEDAAALLRAIPAAAATAVTTSMTGDNGSCIPPPGTQCYEEHTGHPHNGWDPHSHIWTRNQNPTTGACFWNRGRGTSGATQFPPSGMRSCSAYPTWPEM